MRYRIDQDRCRKVQEGAESVKEGAGCAGSCRKFQRMCRKLQEGAGRIREDVGRISKCRKV